MMLRILSELRLRNYCQLLQLVQSYESKWQPCYVIIVVIKRRDCKKWHLLHIVAGPFFLVDPRLDWGLTLIHPGCLHCHRCHPISRNLLGSCPCHPPFCFWGAFGTPILFSLLSIRMACVFCIHYIGKGHPCPLAYVMHGKSVNFGCLDLPSQTCFDFKLENFTTYHKLYQC